MINKNVNKKKQRQKARKNTSIVWKQFKTRSTITCLTMRIEGDLKGIVIQERVNENVISRILIKNSATFKQI